MKKKFTKEFLLNEVLDYDPELQVEDEIIEHTRWSVIHNLVFKDPESGNFFQTTYSVGATEAQVEGPFEYDPGEIECRQVKKKEVKTYKWVPVK